MSTIKDISNEAGVAKSTVSNVFTGNKYVSPEIKARVLEIAKKHDYSPNFYARSLSNKNDTKIIGLFFENREADGRYQPFYDAFIRSLVINGRQEGFSILIYFGLSDGELLNKLRLGQAPIEAAVLVSPSINDERVSLLSECLVPYVVLGNPFGNTEGLISSVDTNNSSLTEKIAGEMKKKGRNVVLINANVKLTVSQDRDLGFKKVLGEDAIIYHSEHSTKEDGYYFASRSLKAGATGIICTNGFMAAGVYEAIQDSGKKIGIDIDVFSLGYSYSDSLVFNPSLSYAAQDYDEFGRIAIKCISDFEEGKNISKKIFVESKISYHDSFFGE